MRERREQRGNISVIERSIPIGGEEQTVSNEDE